MSSPTVLPQIDIDGVVTCFRNSVRKARTEEDVRVWVSRCIEEGILEPFGIKEVGMYEYTLVSGARVDALYGHVIIEYKAPGKLSAISDIRKAVEQVIRYITQETSSKAEWSRYLGVIISDRIAFVRYDPRRDTWILRGPYEIRREVIIKLVEALRGLKRKPLDVEHLLRDFGPESSLTVRLVKALYSKVIGLEEGSRAKLLFNDWVRLFRQATGYKPEKLKELPRLAKEYGISGTVNYDALIFSIHTYYALLLKLIAAEIVYLYGGGKFYRSYIAELDNAYSERGLDGLKEALQELESGGMFKRLMNIENFLEGDYFSWYLDVLDRELADLIAELARRLADYEVATPQLEPEFARDLLKRLYQNLVPRDLRHGLGEYYTPDWLANYLLDEVGLSLENLLKIGEEDPLKPLELRVLDPACGSGTFLVLYISRLRRYAEEHYLQDTLINYILKNVVGFDLNPLAVLTARTNYLLAIADLLTYATGLVEIPIYLADSIMVERRTSLVGNIYVLRTSVGEFEIPVSVAEKGLLTNILAEVTICLEGKYRVEDFKKRLESAYKLNSGELDALAELYGKILKLEEEGKNRVWVAVIRNAFAPILKGRFNYVVGNPPWVNWGNLPEAYREVSMPLWFQYGLAVMRGKVGLGKVRRDLAMLFLARCFDLYLKEGGKLGFLMPFTVFKTQAGAGFRNFLARKSKIHVVHDIVTLYPFEGAVNKTSAVVVEKLCEVDLDRVQDDVRRKACIEALSKAFEDNVRGIKHVIWINPSGRAIPTDKPLEEVLKETERYEVLMIPLEPRRPETSWMQLTPRVIEAVRKLLTGPQYYKAHEGINVALNQVYHVKIRGRRPDGKLIITNPPEPGQKKRVKQVDAVVEPDLVYPLIRGRDIKKWYVEFNDRYIVLPVDVEGKDISLNDMRTKYPNTYSYFFNFFNDLVNRGGEPYKSKLEAYRKIPLNNAEKIAPPFYWVFNAKPSLAPYKVVWKEISARMQVGGFHVAVVEPIQDMHLGSRIVVPDHTVVLIPLMNRDEAYYLAGILNSILITFIFQYAVVSSIESLRLFKFDPNNELHKRIAELSKKAHKLVRCIYAEKKPDYCSSIRNPEEELKHVEKEINIAVAQLYGLSEDDLRIIESLLAILSGEELPVEEVELPEEPKVSVLNTLLPPDMRSYVEVDVVNPSGEEVEFYFEFPWGKGSFKIVEGKCRIEAPPLKPGKYNGILKYWWRDVEKVVNVVIEVSEQLGPKRRRGLLPDTG